MKRTISIMLLALLLAISAFALAACDGGVSTEEQWNAALDYVRDCTAATVKTEKKYVDSPDNLKKWTIKTSTTLAFDADKGILYLYQLEAAYNVIGVNQHENYTEWYYVIEGSNLQKYNNTQTKWSEGEWEKGETVNCDDAEDAALQLRELFLQYFPVELDYLVFEEYSLILYGGKFEKSEKSGNYNTKTKITFSGGKLTNYEYKSEPANKTVDDTTDKSFTVKYTANVSLPQEVTALR